MMRSRRVLGAGTGVRARCPRARAMARAMRDAGSGIVAAAARAFAQHGYDATSIRSIARDAGVDPGLVRHYFTDKAGLFAEALSVPVRPDRIVREVLSGPRKHIGENLVRFLVTTLDEPGNRARVLRIIHTALGQEFAATMLRQFLKKEVLGRIAKGLDEANRCDRLLLLRDGHLLADLTPAELLSSTGQTDPEEAFLALIQRSAA